MEYFRLDPTPRSSVTSPATKKVLGQVIKKVNKVKIPEPSDRRGQMKGPDPTVNPKKVNPIVMRPPILNLDGANTDPTTTVIGPTGPTDPVEQNLSQVSILETDVLNPVQCTYCLQRLLNPRALVFHIQDWHQTSPHRRPETPLSPEDSSGEIIEIEEAEKAVDPNISKDDHEVEVVEAEGNMEADVDHEMGRVLAPTDTKFRELPRIISEREEFLKNVKYIKDKRGKEKRQKEELLS